MTTEHKPTSERPVSKKPEFFVPFAYSALDQVHLPEVVGYREERNPRWLWLRKRQVPIFEWPPVITKIEWKPDGL